MLLKIFFKFLGKLLFLQALKGVIMLNVYIITI